MTIHLCLTEPFRDQYGSLLSHLANQLIDLGFKTMIDDEPRPEETTDDIYIELVPDQTTHPLTACSVRLDNPQTLLERILQAIPLNFEALPLLFEGESKIVRLWTDRVVVMRLKPTVYSYTMNRYGEVAGTEQIRAKFTAALFRKMAALEPKGNVILKNAFLAELPSPGGSLLAQRRVETCNIETRIKRYHIGSPLHRYRYTERYPTTQSCGPLRRWSRLDQPVVCFDWRHPLHDDEGNRLADEPISDDYAGVWMHNVAHAKELARATFLWLEELFERAEIRLVDMCIFIDREGKMIYGEISPDCMRVKLGLQEPSLAESADKDVWRTGGSPNELYHRYEELYNRLFGTEECGSR
jgi:phosphoribosylaminoimidazole-succinocarboxamide synthase